MKKKIVDRTGGMITTISTSKVRMNSEHYNTS